MNKRIEHLASPLLNDTIRFLLPHVEMAEGGKRDSFPVDSWSNKEDRLSLENMPAHKHCASQAQELGYFGPPRGKLRGITCQSNTDWKPCAGRS